MTINVLDTAAGMEAVLQAAEGERSGLLRSMLVPMEGMYRYFPGQVDLAAMHGLSFGFPLDRDSESCREGLARLTTADAWGRIEKALANAVEVQVQAVPEVKVPDITVLLVLGDPADEYFMGPAKGLSGNGSATGFISLTQWPNDENLDRLEAAAVHELNHNLRYAPGGVVWDPAAVTVGEQVVSEGLADAFARQLYGDQLGYTPMGVPHLHDDAVFEKVLSGLDVGGMQNFTAWVHGDEAAARFGAEPVGLPAGAGYAAGNRLVDRFLAATGLSAAQALHQSSRHIIETALNHS
ncbi:DUF2268 domain-containing protein [Arthrobacter sp. zg-Y826]|uniref:DUF2268 domain-containing protein n=1 Tax=Arthrobacter jinronghuae TaxID=2964609 RepID=UPI00210734C8|nr:DUF2268 domain-containing putative Zn-dependent protease [Arthrobacter jinronghuae]MCQ1957442.1 DUF2268 domain-containing protein [Arthrobacter jinronghuae]